MPGAYTEALGEALYAVFKARLPDQTQRPRNRARRPQPRRRSRRTFRPAAEAWPVSGLGGCSRRRKVANVFFFRCGRRTRGAAINPAATHSDEELSIKARVA